MLRRYLDGADKPAALPRRQPAKARLAAAAPGRAGRRRLRAIAAPPPSRGAPGSRGLRRRRCAVTRRQQAQGWPGNRKAYISHVWHTMRERRPEWGLTEIEFKCMLAEAHRAGSLALANADLKDNSSIKDLQDSAVVYKNAVFHFIRVDG